MQCPDTPKAVAEFYYKINEEWEQRLRLVVKPKPRWMPARLHGWLLNRLLKQTSCPVYARPTGHDPYGRIREHVEARYNCGCEGVEDCAITSREEG